MAARTNSGRHFRRRHRGADPRTRPRRARVTGICVPVRRRCARQRLPHHRQRPSRRRPGGRSRWRPPARDEHCDRRRPPPRDHDRAVQEIRDRKVRTRCKDCCARQRCRLLNSRERVRDRVESGVVLDAWTRRASKRGRRSKSVSCLGRWRHHRRTPAGTHWVRHRRCGGNWRVPPSSARDQRRT